MTIYVPSWLHKRMERYGDAVNWSGVAQRAFVLAMDRLDLLRDQQLVVEQKRREIAGLDAPQEETDG
jgi:hypothetical protein